MADAFTGEIRLFPYNFAPAGWLLCDGSRLPVTQYPALYSILGVAYGGDGRTYFQIPNLLGANVVGQGQGPGLTVREVGEAVGEATVTVTTTTMPPHTHQLNGFDDNSSTILPVGAPGAGAYFTFPQTTDDSSNAYSVSNPHPNVTLAPTSVFPTTPTAAHENRQPFLTLGYYMCVDYGIYPSKP